MSILYISAILPKQSETFVYNEVLRLRESGVSIELASVNPATEEFEDERLQSMVGGVVPVYAGGMFALWHDVFSEGLTHPGASLRTVSRGLADAVWGGDVKLRDRPKVFWHALAGLALARRIRAKAIHHIHAHFAHVPTTIAMYTATHLGIGFSFTGHANDLFQRRILLPVKLRRASFAACISRWHRELYKSYQPDLSDERLPVIRCGVTVPKVLKGESVSPPRILGVGRLVQKKGFDVLIKALARLHASGTRFSCRIIGDGPMRGELEALIHREGISDTVTLVGGQPHDRVLEEIQLADLFALPCRTDDAGDRDGIPVVLMEAMAAGVPVISGDVPSIRELVTHDETGITVPSGDMDALAESIERLLTDRNDRARLAAAGRQRVIDEFEAVDNAHRLAACFRRFAITRGRHGRSVGSSGEVHKSESRSVAELK